MLLRKCSDIAHNYKTLFRPPPPPPPPPPPIPENSVKALKVNDLTEIQRSVLHFLQRFMKYLNQKEFCRFLKFVTGGDVLPEHPIQVTFTENIVQAPRSRTCVPQLELQDTYNCYNEVAEEFTSILNCSDSFLFLIYLDFSLDLKEVNFLYN